MKLTSARVRELPIPKHGQAFYWDAETKGFGVRVTAAGNRSFIVQSRVRGKTRRVTLGSTTILSCDEAKRRALKNLLGMYDGIDPQSERRKQGAETLTLRSVMSDYITHKQTKNGPLRESSKKSIETCITKYFKEWADRPVTEITREKCVQKFRELSRTAPVQTNLKFRNLRALLNWARETNVTNEGHYTILPINPVSLMFKSESWNPERPRTGRIKKNKIGTVWNLLQASRDIGSNRKSTTTCSDLIAFMLLTGARLSEATMLTWDRVRLFDAVPTFHLGTTKNHNPVTLPIGDVLLEILLERYEHRLDSKFVFPAVRGKCPHMISTSSLFARISAVAGEHQTNHNLRRTFEDICQYCGVDGDRRRQLLNHLASDVHGKAYANNPDPEELLSAVQAVGRWIVAQANIAREQQTGKNVIHLSSCM